MSSDQKPDIAPSLKPLFADLDAELTALGLTRSAAGDGWSYKRGRSLICRIDPKNSKGCLRVWVGDGAEAAAPAVLRGDYRQTGWLVVWPQHRDVAVDYILACARRRLPDIAAGGTRYFLGSLWTKFLSWWSTRW